VDRYRGTAPLFRFVMKKLESEPAGTKVHIKSAAPGSVDRTCHRISESVESNSVPRGSWSKAPGVGQGREPLPGAPTFSPCAPFYLPTFALKNADIAPILPPFPAALQTVTSSSLGPIPSAFCSNA
jgi:hypothetical protein